MKESKFIRVVATFTFRMDADSIDTSNINVGKMQTKADTDGRVDFNCHDGDSCVINSVELL